MNDRNPYLYIIYSIIPRLLALYDNDQTSHTYGVGDRYRWAWKLIDFGNATFQGAAHGLSRLLVNNMLPEYFSARAVISRIDAMFFGVESLRYANGSLEEAFPYESSFSVSALIAYDLLSSVELLSSYIDAQTRTRFLKVIAPIINFLHQADEIF